MKSAKIFLVEGKEKLVPMQESSYGTEADLQTLLEDYPDLLPGDQIDPDDPRRWLLIAREMSVPGEFGGGRWSLDHLFLDQDGIPTFVECKRASDTRIRREVVAQMLEYAANGIAYWSLDALRLAAAETLRQRDKSLDDEILALVDSNDLSVIEDFWIRVEQNLKAGKIRLIFVADAIPAELRRLVEFLNEKLNDVEVLAVEVKQFLGVSQKALVPRVLGMTETARNVKRRSVTGRPHTNREEFLSKCDPVSTSFFSEILNNAEARGFTIYWGEVGFSIRTYLSASKDYASTVYGFPPNDFQVYFGHLPFPAEEIRKMRQELLRLARFREAPKTLKLALTENNLNEARQAYEFMLSHFDSQVKE